MERLEVPGLYRLSVGNPRWGWHKMDELQTAVGSLFEHASKGLPASLSDGSIGGRPSARALIRQFGHLNIERTFGWSNGKTLGFSNTEDVPCEMPNLFVTAMWSLAVISAVKIALYPQKPHGLDLFKLARHCLTERELAIMEHKLGLVDGKHWSPENIAIKFNCRGPHIRKVQASIKRKLERENLIPLRPGSE